MSEHIQKLLDTWASRPRRQLDLAIESDMLWMASVINSMIKAAPVIAAKFGLTPNAAPIIIELEPGSTIATAVEAMKTEREKPKVPSQLSERFEPGVTIPSSPAGTGPAAGPSNHIPADSQSTAGTGAKTGRKPGKRGKSASVGATPAAAPQTAAAPRASSPLPPAIAAKESGAVPPPKLEPIG